MEKKQKKSQCKLLMFILVLGLIAGLFMQAAPVSAISEKVEDSLGGPILSKGATAAEGREGQWRVVLTIDGAGAVCTADMVLMIDGATHLTEKGKREEAENAALSFVQAFFAQEGNRRVGRISFSDQGDALTEFWGRAEQEMIKEAIAQHMIPATVQGIVKDTLGEHVEIVPNSIVTSQGWATYDEERQMVIWETGKISEQESVGLSYLIRFKPGFSPQSKEWYAANQRAVYTYTTDAGEEDEKVFPVPMIRGDEHGK